MLMFLALIGVIAMPFLIAPDLRRVRRRERIRTPWFTDIDGDDPMYDLAALRVYAWVGVIGLIWLGLLALILSGIWTYLVWWWAQV